jgi:hypothetical protein
MGDPDPGSDRRMAARSRYCRFWSSAVSGPGIRVIELHVLGMQVQLLSINMGWRSPPLSPCRSPANAAHWRVDRTITVERRHGFVTVMDNKSSSRTASSYCCCCRKFWSV